MKSNTVVYSWKRSLPGRERLSASHFEELMGYLAGLQKDGVVASFEPVLLDPNGSGADGFIIIRTTGDTGLGALLDREDFADHIIRSRLHLDAPALDCGVTGPAVRERMARWIAHIP